VHCAGCGYHYRDQRPLLGPLTTIRLLLDSRSRASQIKRQLGHSVSHSWNLWKPQAVLSWLGVCRVADFALISFASRKQDLCLFFPRCDAREIRLSQRCSGGQYLSQYGEKFKILELSSPPGRQSPSRKYSRANQRYHQYIIVGFLVRKLKPATRLRLHPKDSRSAIDPGKIPRSRQQRTAYRSSPDSPGECSVWVD
jgi:hypothetical protein